MITEIFIGNDRLDLFEDDSINLVQGIQDVSDISKVSADFSQTFSVPASDNNNTIFRHYYNADINNGFDARTRKEGFINVNGVPFKFGKFRLEGATLEDGQPKAYRITFFGDAIKLKDEIGDDRLIDLDWLDNFDHDYSSTIVRNALTTGLDFTVDGVLYPQAIVYPLIGYNRQYFYNSDITDTTDTERSVNIAYDSGRVAGVGFGDLKPAIKLSIIINAIEEKYGFSFGGGFFQAQNYKDIYINLNNNTEPLNSGVLEYENVNGNSPPEGSAREDKLRYRTEITPRAGFENTQYKVALTWNTETIFESQSFTQGIRSFTGFQEVPTSEYVVTATVITEENFEFDATTRLTYERRRRDPLVLEDNSYTNQIIDLRARITKLIADIKVYDLITSLFKTFNLIVESNGKDLLFEDLVSWYAQGEIVDITPYVDTRKLNVSKGVLRSVINLKFEESEQILADQFNKNNRVYYGDIEQNIYEDESQTALIDGDELDIETLFENPIYERLLDINTGELVSIQYCPYFDREISPLTGNPFMFYAYLNETSNNTIGFNTTTTYEEINVPIFMPSHQREIDNYSSFALNFNAELSEYTYQAMPNNIYSTYYADYIGDIFSSKRRNYILEAILPDIILQNLRLNTRLVIGNTRFIINKISSNIVNRKDRLELINDIYNAPLASDIINNSVFVPSSSTLNNTKSSNSTQYIGLKNRIPLLVDDGFGTSWVTIDNFGNDSVSIINYSVSANETGLQRTARIQIMDGINNPSFSILQE